MRVVPHAGLRQIVIAIRCFLIRADRPPRACQGLLRSTMLTTDKITETSMSTPTTVAGGALEPNPNKLIAAAAANSKNVLAPISPDGAATQCASSAARLSRLAYHQLT